MYTYNKEEDISILVRRKSKATHIIYGCWHIIYMLIRKGRGQGIQA